METEERRQRLRKILGRLARSGGTGHGEVARHYPGGVEGLERDWRAWLADGARLHRY